ncbi:MAG: hypothetical protein ABI758_05150 [Candidatus Woesebacteria bacterium]
MQDFTSHGKIILSGEHSVVYGYPALVCPVDQEVKVVIQKGEQKKTSPFLLNILSIFQNEQEVSFDDLLIVIESTLPLGSGLGSSAATASAVFQALYCFFKIKYTKKHLLFLVQESEKFAHGNPSGVDAVAVVYPSIIEFQKTDEQIEWDIIATGKALPPFLLLQSGIPSETTREMVEYVKTFSRKEEILPRIGKITQKMIKKLKEKHLDLGLITQNERLLEELGVVGQKALSMIHQIESKGGVAKIVGAGGRENGSGVIIAFHPTNISILREVALQNEWEII